MTLESCLRGGRHCRNSASSRLRQVMCTKNHRGCLPSACKGMGDDTYFCYSVLMGLPSACFAWALGAAFGIGALWHIPAGDARALQPWAAAPSQVRWATLKLIIEAPPRPGADVAARDAAKSPAAAARPGPAESTVASAQGKPVAQPPADAKAAAKAKCFDELLNLSLGDDDPAAKERLKKAKCQ